MQLPPRQLLSDGSALPLLLILHRTLVGGHLWCQLMLAWLLRMDPYMHTGSLGLRDP
jgi:hypothetical protein